MYFIAHRGKVEKSDTDNSRASFLKALSLPYIDGIECDVRITKDKRIVVIHDPVIDFVSNGSGIVKQMTIEELSKYQYGDNNHNEPILLLEELLSSINTTKLIVIELKGTDNDLELVNEVNKIIKKYKQLNIVIISFSYELLSYFRKINKEVKLGILIGYFLNHKYVYNHFTYNLFAPHYLDYIFMNKGVMFFNITKKEQLNKIKNKKDDIYIITDYSKHFSSFD